MPDLVAIQKAHPEWGIIDAIDAPGGGVWAVNSRGEVFNLDQSGNPTSDAALSPYFGGYTGLKPGQRQGTRTFVAIQSDPSTGGYTLVSHRGERYAFGDPNFTPPTQQAVPGLPPGAPPPPDPGQGALTAALGRLGLSELTDWAFNRYRETGGSVDTVMFELEETPQFKARFPGLEYLREQGRAWSPAQYIDYEQRAIGAATAAGIPAGFMDREDIGNLIRNNVSLNELQDRIAMAAEATYLADPDTIHALESYGVQRGELVAYFLEPNKAEPFIQRRLTYQAAGLSGAASRSGFGSLSLDEATRLAQQGMTQGQATQAFGQAELQKGLTQELLGETEDLNRSTQLSAIEGNAPAAQALERRKAQRTARFEGGGGSAGFGGQRSGLGSAGS